eukprot:IDg5693t1
MFLVQVLFIILSLIDIPFGLSVIPCASRTECQRLHSTAVCNEGLCTASYLNMTCRSHSACNYGQACIAKKCQFATVGDPCLVKYGCVSGSECVKNNCAAGGISCSPYVCKAAPDTHYCSAASRQCPKDCNGDLMCKLRSFFFDSVCIRPPEYARSNAPDGFGSCKVDLDCPHGYYKKLVGTRRVDQHCVQGRCHSVYVGEECSEKKRCENFLSCVNGRCDYATEGMRCRRSSSAQPCFPGHRCYNRTGGAMGTCGRGVSGVRCDDPIQCVEGLMCGFNRRCLRNAEGQRCESDFWCPNGARCLKSSKTCTYRMLGRNDKDFIPVKWRAASCKTRSDCSNLEVKFITVYDTECLNGVCLPSGIGANCNRPLYGLTNQMNCIDGKIAPRNIGDSCDMHQQCYQGLVA